MTATCTEYSNSNETPTPAGVLHTELESERHNVEDDADIAILDDCDMADTPNPAPANVMRRAPMEGVLRRVLVSLGELNVYTLEREQTKRDRDTETEPTGAAIGTERVCALLSDTQVVNKLLEERMRLDGLREETPPPVIITTAGVEPVETNTDCK